MYRQGVFQRQRLEWIHRPAFCIRGDTHRHHIFALLQQSLQHGAAEGLLSMNNNTHFYILLDRARRFDCGNFFIRVTQHIL